MTEFRQQLRDAFAAEQSRLEPLGDTPRRLLDAGLGRQRRPQPAQHLAAFAALVLAIVVVAAVVTLARPHQPVVTARPRPTAVPTAVPTATSSPAASPSPAAHAFTAPDTVPAIVFADVGNRNQLDAVAWNGSGFGSLPVTGRANPNATATFFATRSGIVDRRGHAMGTPALGASEVISWADDGRTLCRITPQSVGVGSAPAPASFQVTSIAGAWHTVGQYGTVTENGGVEVAACSVLNDRAVLVEKTYQGPNVRQFWVVQLSTQRVVWHHSYTGNESVSIVASRDGNLVAEGRSTCCPASAVKTTVYGPTGGVIRTLDGQAGGLTGAGFSWDGTRMVLAGGPDESRVTVVDVRSGATVWGAPEGLKVAGVAAEPLPGGRLGIELNASGAVAGPTGYVPAADLYLVDANGAALRLPIKVMPL